jgi:transcriptional regulator with XRE-family HTH domain
MNLGSYIKKYRKQRQMTQTYLAKLMEVSSSAVSLWEASEGTPTKENLKRLSVALEVDYHKLVNYYNEYKKAYKEKKAEKQPKKLTVPEFPPASFVEVFGDPVVMAQDGVALTSIEHPMVEPKPVAWVDKVWIERPDLVPHLDISKLFSRTEFINQVPLYSEAQIGYTQEQVNRLMDMAARQNREWVSLTNDDISAAYNENYKKSFDYMPYNFFISVYQVIESKLREKNNG